MYTGQTQVGEGQLREEGEFWTLGSDDILLRILLRKLNTSLALAVISDITGDMKTFIFEGDYSDRLLCYSQVFVSVPVILRNCCEFLSSDTLPSKEPGLAHHHRSLMTPGQSLP